MYQVCTVVVSTYLLAVINLRQERENEGLIVRRGPIGKGEGVCHIRGRE